MSRPFSLYLACCVRLCLFRTSGQCALSKLKLPTVKLTTDNNRSHGNAAFIRDLTSWVFQETGVVKVTGTKHSRVGEVVPREQYTKMDNLVRILFDLIPVSPSPTCPLPVPSHPHAKSPLSLFLPPFPLVSRPKPTRPCTPTFCIRDPLWAHTVYRTDPPHRPTRSPYPNTTPAPSNGSHFTSTLPRTRPGHFSSISSCSTRTSGLLWQSYQR